MAKRLDSLELLLSCEVCFSDYEESGDHVPRILPCSHTLCHMCIGQMIRRNRIECPECREKHETKKEIRESFPQNKYILTNIKRKAASKLDETYAVGTCEEHGKELILFCRETKCMKPICPTCLTKSHFGHKVFEIEEERKEVFVKKNIESLTENLGKRRSVILSAKEDTGRKIEKVLTDLKRMKEQIDNIIKEVEDQQKEVNTQVTDEVSAINENITLLTNIRDNAASEPRYDEIMKNLDTVRTISESVEQHLSGKRTYRYFSDREDSGLEEIIRNNIVQKEMTVDLSEQTIHQSRDSEFRGGEAEVARAASSGETYSLRSKGNS